MVRKDTTRRQTTAKAHGKAQSISLRERLANLSGEFFLNQTKDFNFLVSLVVLIVAFGLVMVLSASNVDSIINSGNPFGAFTSQLIWALLGLGLMFFISKRSVEQIERFGLLLFLGSLVGQLLALVPGLGVSSGGNTNWIGFGPFIVQPSEFMKLGLIVFMATFLSRRIDTLWDWRVAGMPAMIAGFGAAGMVFVLGRDLGTAAVMLAIVCSLVFLAGLPWQHLMRFVVAMAAVFIMGSIISPSRVARFLTFFNQGAANDGSDWQVRHGIWALASGGVGGTGLGRAKLNWGWVPEIENDFIFASIGEELGFVGALVVLALFFLLFQRLRRMANTHVDPFASLAVMGIMLWITIQALINIAVVLHLMPTLGVPLPFISKGGSSLISLLMGIGVVLALERQKSLTPTRRKR
ncbi:MAG: putative lipid flippase FtsW [Actinomycetota bacterium]